MHKRCRKYQPIAARPLIMCHHRKQEPKGMFFFSHFILFFNHIFIRQTENLTSIMHTVLRLFVNSNVSVCVCMCDCFSVSVYFFFFFCCFNSYLVAHFPPSFSFPFPSFAFIAFSPVYFQCISHPVCSAKLLLPIAMGSYNAAAYVVQF